VTHAGGRPSPTRAEQEKGKGRVAARERARERRPGARA
jgi:hypothetical protein